MYNFFFENNNKKEEDIEDIEEAESSSEESESSSEESEESESSEESKDDDCNENYYEDFLKYIKHEDEFHGYAICPVKNFIYYVENWSGQRDLNQEHIKKLQDEIIETKYIMGSFKILMSRDKKTLKLIDGQHRCLAIKNIIKINNSFNPFIMIEIFYVNDVDSEESLKIFIKANSNLIFDVMKDIPELVILKIIKKLSDKFDTIIDLPEGKRCNRPNTSKKKLHLKLKKTCNFKYKDIEYADEYVQKIIKLNKKYSNYSRKKFNEHMPKNKKITEKMYLKACNSGWYLGLFPTLSWLNKINT